MEKNKLVGFTKSPPKKRKTCAPPKTFALNTPAAPSPTLAQHTDNQNIKFSSFYPPVPCLTVHSGRDRSRG